MSNMLPNQAAERAGIAGQNCLRHERSDRVKSIGRTDIDGGDRVVITKVKIKLRSRSQGLLRQWETNELKGKASPQGEEDILRRA